MQKLSVISLLSLMGVSSVCAMEEAGKLIPVKTPVMQLVKAIKYKTYDKCKAIVEKYPDVVHGSYKAYSDEEYTPLHIAVDRNNIAVAELLLASGALCNAATKLDRYTPVHMVHSKEMIKLLLKYGSQLTNKTCCGEAPLGYLLFHYFDYGSGGCERRTFTDEQRCDLAHCLLKKGADINEIVDNQKNSPLHKAVEYGDGLIVQFLLEHNASVENKNKNGDMPIEVGLYNYASRQRAIEQFRIKGTVFSPLYDENNHFDLLKNGASLFKKIISSGCDKYKKNTIENSLARLFIDISNSKNDYEGKRIVKHEHHGYCFNNATFVDLENWVGKEAIDCVRRYCEHRCKEALLAVKNGDNQQLESIVCNYSYVLAYDKSIAFDILDYAIISGGLNFGWFLERHFDRSIDEVCDLSIVDQQGYTLLHKAVFWKKAEAIKQLIKHNISLTAHNNNGQTALDLLRATNNKDCVEAFNNAFIDKIFSTYSYQEFYQEIKKILKRGFDVNMLDERGKSLLQRAVKGHPEKCSLLLKYGAIVTQKMIADAGSYDVRVLLQKYYDTQNKYNKN